jgi:hypothetical protein
VGELFLLTNVGSIAAAMGKLKKIYKKFNIEKVRVLLCHNCALVFPAGVDEHQLAVA